MKRRAHRIGLNYTYLRSEQILEAKQHYLIVDRRRKSIGWVSIFFNFYEARRAFVVHNVHQIRLEISSILPSHVNLREWQQMTFRGYSNRSNNQRRALTGDAVDHASRHWGYFGLQKISSLIDASFGRPSVGQHKYWPDIFFGDGKIALAVA